MSRENCKVTTSAKDSNSVVAGSVADQNIYTNTGYNKVLHDKSKAPESIYLPIRNIRAPYSSTLPSYPATQLPATQLPATQLPHLL